jgi:hypothetical protein
MNDMVKATGETLAPAEVIGRLSAPRFFGSEDPGDYAALRAAMLPELDPRTAYEVSLAENLVRYAWEIARMQRFRDNAMLSRYQNLALEIILDVKSGDSRLCRAPTDDDRLLALHLTFPDEETRTRAEEDFTELTRQDPHDVMAIAYSRSSEISTLERRLVDLERRGKDLREEYCRLTSMRPQVIEDAEIVEAEDGK